MSTSRRESERGSLSGADLLGKLFVRRTSHGPKLPSSPVQDSLIDSDTMHSTSAHRMSIGNAFGFHFGGINRRFSRAVDESCSQLPSVEEETNPERRRRRKMESMSFAAMHSLFEPLHRPEEVYCLIDNKTFLETKREEDEESSDADSDSLTSDDNQADEEDTDQGVRRQSREATAGFDDFSDEEEKQSNSHCYDCDDDCGEDAEGLKFDHANFNVSVKRLVQTISSASMSGEFGHIGSSVLSNQDEEEASRRDSASDDSSDSSRHEDEGNNPILPEVKEALAKRAYLANTTNVMRHNCYIPMDEVQEELTTSVRRLVIDLKRDSEEQDTGGGLPFTRRRGNSLPSDRRPQHRSSKVDSSASTAVSISMDVGPTEPPKYRKRSTLARLAPRLFDNFRRKRKSYLYTDEELETVDGARWKIVELAFRFGGKHRFYLVQAVNMFFPLIKYGRHGGPHTTRLHCNRCGTLQWQHKRGGLSESVDLADVLQVIEGRQTAVFRKYLTNKDLESCSFSIIFQERTLDLETQSPSHRDWLMSALRTLITYARKQRQAEQRAIAEQALLPLEDASPGSMCGAYDVMMTSPRANLTPTLLW
ncbi:hypothetical protein Poli38472_000924 [Pythium oligandrum]|uniref:PH domain-containing protein n=1 Tax=Pythium oligandrum TaxID=41045 RepID=A0A8K1CER7_PYTOL|nr:hypothetical protein Poli38472_000924 [Pythium oligandrum]|eukprot:TMW60882.1 hypothetical protein Poli38472_000924 [Pythium oligandrum]